MMLQSIAKILLAGGCAVMNGQQVLLVKPGGIVVIDKCYSISTAQKKLSDDEMQFEYDGHLYPNGGQNYFKMMEENPKKYNVIDRISIKNENICFDGKPVDLGVRIYRIDKALKWGDLIACLCIVPNESKHWLEPKKAHALIVFSPKAMKGGIKGLYSDAGKAACDIWILDSMGEIK